MGAGSLRDMPDEYVVPEVEDEADLSEDSIEKSPELRTDRGEVTTENSPAGSATPEDQPVGPETLDTPTIQDPPTTETTKDQQGNPESSQCDNDGSSE